MVLAASHILHPDHEISPHQQHADQRYHGHRQHVYSAGLADLKSGHACPYQADANEHDHENFDQKEETIDYASADRGRNAQQRREVVGDEQRHDQ